MDYMDYMGCKLDLSFLCVLVSCGIRGVVVLTNKLSFMDPPTLTIMSLLLPARKEWSRYLLTANMH